MKLKEAPSVKNTQKEVKLDKGLHDFLAKCSKLADLPISEISAIRFCSYFKEDGVTLDSKNNTWIVSLPKDIKSTLDALQKKELLIYNIYSTNGFITFTKAGENYMEQFQGSSSKEIVTEVNINESFISREEYWSNFRKELQKKD